MEEKLTLKLLMKSGQALIAYADEDVKNIMVNNPKFLKMTDVANDIYLSIDDIAAFEIMNNRTEQNPEEALENNGKETSTTAV